MNATDELIEKRLRELGDPYSVWCSTGSPPIALAITNLARALGLPRKRIVKVLYRLTFPGPREVKVDLELDRVARRIEATVAPSVHGMNR